MHKTVETVSHDKSGKNTKCCHTYTDDRNYTSARVPYDTSHSHLKLRFCMTVSHYTDCPAVPACISEKVNRRLPEQLCSLQGYRQAICKRWQNKRSQYGRCIIPHCIINRLKIVCYIEICYSLRDRDGCYRSNHTSHNSRNQTESHIMSYDLLSGKSEGNECAKKILFISDISP